VVVVVVVVAMAMAIEGCEMEKKGRSEGGSECESGGLRD